MSNECKSDGEWQECLNILTDNEPVDASMNGITFNSTGAGMTNEEHQRGIILLMARATYCPLSNGRCRNDCINYKIEAQRMNMDNGYVSAYCCYFKKQIGKDMEYDNRETEENGYDN